MSVSTRLGANSGTRTVRSDGSQKRGGSAESEPCILERGAWRARLTAAFARAAAPPCLQLRSPTPLQPCSWAARRRVFPAQTQALLSERWPL
eukprot:3047632-Rhodomonas_salina.1